MTTIAERVAEGAALLDQEEPGWEARIDLETLNLDNPCGCVLGQLFGWYGRGTGALRLNVDAASDHAFEVTDDGPDTYRGLTRAWKALIRERRNQAAARPAEGQSAGEGERDA